MWGKAKAGGGGSWKPHGGAQLATWGLGACLSDCAGSLGKLFACWI